MGDIDNQDKDPTRPQKPLTDNEASKIPPSSENNKGPSVPSPEIAEVLEGAGNRTNTTIRDLHEKRESPDKLLLSDTEVVIVDDEYAISELFSKIAQTQGAKNIQTFPNGVEFINALKEEGRIPIGTLVILDMKMPKMGGCAAAKAAWELGRKDLRIIIASGYCEPEEIADLKANGIMKTFLSKPTSISDFVSAMREALSQQRKEENPTQVAGAIDVPTENAESKEKPRELEGVDLVVAITYPAMRESTSLIAENEGANVNALSNAEEFEKILPTLPQNAVVIVDIEIFKGGGEKLIQELRETGRTDIKFIVQGIMTSDNEMKPVLRMDIPILSTPGKADLIKAIKKVIEK